MYETLDPEIRRLLAQRRQELPRHVVPRDDDRVDKVEDGNHIRVLESAGPGDTTVEREMDLTAMYAPAPSTTNDVEILLIEAQIVADGGTLENPHVPATEDVLEEAERRFENEPYDPVWEGSQ
jgi:hypothetical protein